MVFFLDALHVITTVALAACLPVFVGSRAHVQTTQTYTHTCLWRPSCVLLLLPSLLLLSFDYIWCWKYIPYSIPYTMLKSCNANWKTALCDWIFWIGCQNERKKTLTRLTNDFWKYKQGFFLFISHRSCDECLVKLRGAKCIYELEQTRKK